MKLLIISIVIITCTMMSFGSEKHTIPHPINTTMGIPDPVGSYNIRFNTFRHTDDNGSTIDFSGHLGYGLFDWGGIHLRSLGIKTFPFTEVIGMVGLWRDQSKLNGISFLGILGIPTAKQEENDHHGLVYLAGIAGRYTFHHNITNDVILHYDFTKDHVIAETGSVLYLFPNTYLIMEIDAIFGKNKPEISLLPALKIHTISNLFIAGGYRAPISSVSSYRNQFYIQIEFGKH